MRKNTLFYENQTLAIKSCLLHLSFGFYTLFQCDLELMAEGRSYPCIRIVFLLNSRKSHTWILVQVSAILVQVGYWCFYAWVYRYMSELYRYRLATIAFLHGCIGTGELYRYRLPLNLFPSIVALPETSPSGFHHSQ